MSTNRIRVCSRRFVAGGDEKLRGEFHLVRRKEFFRGLLDFNRNLRLLVRRKLLQFFSQRVGGLRAQGSKLPGRDGRFEVERHGSLFDVDRAGLRHHAC